MFLRRNLLKQARNQDFAKGGLTPKLNFFVCDCTLPEIRWRLNKNSLRSPEIRLVFGLILNDKAFAGFWLDFGLNADLG